MAAHAAQSIRTGSTAATAGWAAGLDGCRGGWILALAQLRNENGNQIWPELRLCQNFSQVTDHIDKFVAIAIDMPIGLLDSRQAGGRECDQLARRLLEPGRKSSVFSPPIRSDLQAKSYEEVRPGLSIQSYNIAAKIREVDEKMTPKMQAKVFEAHPELAYRDLLGSATLHKKKGLRGREERLMALEQSPCGGWRKIREIFEDQRTHFEVGKVAPDDILDAYVLLWVALRLIDGKARRVPDKPPLDAKGLRMEICF